MVAAERSEAALGSGRHFPLLASDVTVQHVINILRPLFVGNHVAPWNYETIGRRERFRADAHKSGSPESPCQVNSSGKRRNDTLTIAFGERRLQETPRRHPLRRHQPGNLDSHSPHTPISSKVQSFACLKQPLETANVFLRPNWKIAHRGFRVEKNWVRANITQPRLDGGPPGGVSNANTINDYL